MPVYKYKAVNPAGRTLRGSMSAQNETDLYNRLSELKLDLVDASRERESRLARFLSAQVTTRDLIEFCVYMRELIKVGVSVLDAVHDIRESTSSLKLRDVLSEVARDIGNGDLLSDALRRHPRVFNRVFVGVVAAGERTGDLEEAFGHLIGHLKWTDQMNQRLRAATRYPVFVLVTTIGLLLAMMLYLVPELSRFLDSIRMELPPMTIALMATSRFVNDYWWAILGIPVAAFVLLRAAYKSSDAAAQVMDYYIYRLPVFGETMRKIALSRFSHFFAIMYRSGIGVLECLDAGRGVVGNRAMSASLGVARDMVETGAALTDAIKTTGEFPDLVVRMVRVGEESGNLTETLENVSYFYDREVDDSVSTMVNAVQPALTLIVGAIMAWVILAVLGPMYDSFSQLPL